MKKGELNILIGGPAGAGIEKVGRLMTLSFVRSGYFVFGNVEHMSLIRGGNNYLRVRVGEAPHESHVEKIDVMIALDKTTIEEHANEVVDGGVIIYDGENVKLEGVNTGKAKMIDIPLKKLANEELENPVMANTIALGALFGVVGFDLKGFNEVVAKIFAHKSAEIVKLNEKAAEIGYGLAPKGDAKMERKKGENMFLMGNDAFTLGAMKAGCKFVGAYPMTPSSTILHMMAKWSKDYGIVVKHTEDEIAAAGSIVGAGYAGVRALTCTSGGGFALMTEMIGLAGMLEVPCVFVNVMRPGPATGQPTRTEAGDLRQVIHSGQGDPIKIVLLPGTPQDCFEMGFDSFNLSEKYQLPVIVTYDKNLGEGHFTVPPFDDEKMNVDRGKLLTQAELDKIDTYQRYLRTEDGISPRVIPGMKGGTHRATSDEHNEKGEIFEDAENREAMMDKRMGKLVEALEDLPGPKVWGEEEADLTLVTWNSATLACKEAADILVNEGKKVNVVQIRTAYPFHSEEVAALLRKAKKLVVVESNYTAQMAGLIAENTGIKIDEKILRYDGRPITAQYIIDTLEV
jgi:2-oxoglutarate/2-oxoacid ferredoxin oxidoreductase subunit alpha